MVELCQQSKIDIVGIIDSQFVGFFRGIKIIGTDADAEKLFIQYGNVPLVLTPDSPSLREKLYKHYAAFGWKFRNIISPHAIISPSVSFGIGVVIQSGCNVSADVKIGDFVKMNTQSNVMHDSVVGSFSTVAPRAVVLGRVTVGEKVYLGANSTVLPMLSIGENTVVGAGAVVTKSLPAKCTAVGVPAKLIKFRE